MGCHCYKKTGPNAFALHAAKRSQTSVQNAIVSNDSNDLWKDMDSVGLKNESQQNNPTLLNASEQSSHPTQNLKPRPSYFEKLSVCNKCPEVQSFMGTPRCGVCGCFMLVKAALPWLDCPQERWSTVSKE